MNPFKTLIKSAKEYKAVETAAEKIISDVPSGSRVYVKSGDNLVGSVTATGGNSGVLSKLIDTAGTDAKIVVGNADETASLLKATSNANEELAKIVSTGADALKATGGSLLGKVAKTGTVIAGTAGITYLGTMALSSGDNEDVVTQGGGDNYYNYNTGNEKVDEALSWLQGQIDEIVDFLNSLFGGSSDSSGGSSGGAGGTGDTSTDGTTTTTGGSIIKILVVAGIVIAAGVLVVSIVKNRKGKKTGKKGGKRK